MLSPSTSRSAVIGRKEQIEGHVQALRQVIEMTRQPTWSEAVALLATSEQVWIAGFQSERGIAEHMRAELQLLRNGVRGLDRASGSYSDVVLEATRRDCIVLIDLNRHSQHFRQLIELAAEQHIPVIVLTDVHAPWVTGKVRCLFELPTELGMFWASLWPMAMLMDFLFNGVARHMGSSVEERLLKVSELHRHFTGFEVG